LEFIGVHSNHDLSILVKVLHEAHGTVAKEFGFTKENNPTNNAFIDEQTLRTQLEQGIELFQLTINNQVIGCIAIERSKKEIDTFYIEKVSIIPEYRNQGYGCNMMEFAVKNIRENGGQWISIALIDSNMKLKKWYSKQGFKETETKDFPRLPFRVCFMKKQV
jgi:N-acetylglutamate synthase-like GNAT family acetyltransferase